MKLLLYRFEHWALRWIKDDDGDIGLQILGGLITLIKYKEHTIIHFFRRYPNKADKYQGHAADWATHLRVQGMLKEMGDRGELAPSR